MGGFGDDTDYDALEDYLDNLPPVRRYPIAIQTNGFKMRCIASRLERTKKRHAKRAEELSTVLAFEARRPKESVGGWVKADSSYTPEDEKHLRKFFERYLTPKGLEVGEIRCGWYGFSTGVSGNYDMMTVEVSVS